MKFLEDVSLSACVTQHETPIRRLVTPAANRNSRFGTRTRATPPADLALKRALVDIF